MHPYTTDSDERKWVIIYLVVISILLGEASGQITEALSWWGQWFWDFSAVAWFLLLYWLADNCLWRLPFLHLPFLFQLPDLNGEWKGDLQSSWTGFSEDKPCTLTVRQTWTRIHVDFSLDEQTSGSFSIAASVLLDYQGQVTLRYDFINNPAEPYRGTLDTHGGTTQLFLLPDGFQRKLEGRYYTDRIQQTRGTIVVKQPA